MTFRNLYTAFVGTEAVASGRLEEVARAVRELIERDKTAAPLVFDDTTGRIIDLNLNQRGRDTTGAKTLRAPGRPKLGVVAREVTLLSRHWDWLNAQPGGASVVLRGLVDAARHAAPVTDKTRRAREATYRFLTAIAGNQPHYEEAIRALFAGDGARYDALIAGWPVSVQLYAGLLSQDAFEVEAEPVSETEQSPKRRASPR